MDDYEYLQDGFNARTLRKDQLRNILLTHDVPYSNDMLKPALLNLFQSEIVPRRAELRAQFLEPQASDANISDATPPHASEPSLRVPPQRSPTRAAAASSAADSRRARSTARVASPLRNSTRRSPSPRRELSPGRAQPRRTASKGKAEVLDLSKGPVLKPELKPETKPEPEGSEDVNDTAKADQVVDAEPAAIEEPRSPRSPRRRRVTRKVEIPREEHVDVPAPRGPVQLHSRKRTADDSFTTDNVFQKRTKKLKFAEDVQVLNQKTPQDAVAPEPQEPPEENWLRSAPVNTRETSRFGVDLGFDREAPRRDLSEEPPLATLPRIPASAPASASSRASAPPNAPRSAPLNVPANAPRRRLDFPGADERQPSRGFMPSLPLLRSAHLREPSDRESSPDSSMIHDTEEEAAHGLHRVMSSLYNAYPRASVPEAQSPGVDSPEAADGPAANSDAPVPAAARRFALPRVPRLALPRVPRLALPYVVLPYVALPRLPSFKKVITTVATILVGAFLVLLSLSVGALGAWYRDAYALQQYCPREVPHEYPVWAYFDTGFAPISSVQASVRDVLDELWPSCKACPEHAHCFGPNVVCDNGYLPLDRWISLLRIADVPPNCVPDWEAQRKRDALSERSVELLRSRRAEVLCEAESLDGLDGGVSSSTVGSAAQDESLRVAMPSTQLRRKVYDAKSPLLSDSEFDRLWEDAVTVLPSKYPDVHVMSSSIFVEQTLTEQNGDDADKDRASSFAEVEEVFFFSTSDAKMSLSCRWRRSFAQWLAARQQRLAAWLAAGQQWLAVWLAARRAAALRAARRALAAVYAWSGAHRALVLKSGALLASTAAAYIYVQRKLAKRSRQQLLVSQFVARVRDQHELSKKTGDTNYVLTSELRGGLPRAEWQRIQTAVEANGQVRARQIEVNGEIVRIWELA